MRSLYCKKTIVALALLIFLGLARSADAGTVYVSPNTGSYAMGQTFSVKVTISSPAQSVNAVSGQISYPADKLRVVGLSKADSVVNLWVEEPSFSDKKGTLDFSGVVLNPGYIGSRGLVITVIFKAVDQGTAEVDFSSGSLLANDGSGTDVLESLGNAEYEITAPAPVPEKKEITAPAAATEESSAAMTSETAEISPAPAVAETVTLIAPTEECLTITSRMEDLFLGLPFLPIVIATVSILSLLLVGTLLLFRRRVTAETRGGVKTKNTIHETFDGLKADLEEYAKIVEKLSGGHKLTRGEEALIDHMRRNLSDAEKHILSQVD